MVKVVVITVKPIHWYNYSAQAFLAGTTYGPTERCLQGMRNSGATRLQGKKDQAVAASKTQRASTLYQPTPKIHKAKYKGRCKNPGIPRRAFSSRALRPPRVSLIIPERQPRESSHHAQEIRESSHQEVSSCRSSRF